LEREKFILVSAHREENIDNESNFLSLMNAINYVAEHYGMPIIYSTHPRSMKYINERTFRFHPLVQNIKPLGFFDYNKLQMEAFCVLSDSGTLSEEAALMNFNGISIRTSTERPEVLDKGTVILGGINTSEIIQAIELAVNMKNNHEITELASDYKDINVSVKVVKIIQSYTKIVNQVIWRK